MKCKICGKKTTYNKSVGHDSFIVCNTCYYALGDNNSEILDFIFKCGEIAKKEMKGDKEHEI